MSKYNLTTKSVAKFSFEYSNSPYLQYSNILSIFVALKNSIRILSIYLLTCNLNKEKYLIFLFSLSHTLTVFLSISSHGLHLLELKALTCVSLTMAEWLSLLQLSTQGRMASVFFPFVLFSFSASHTPETLPKEWHTNFGSLASLLIKRSKTYPCMLSFALNQRADFVGLRRQAYK